MSNWIQYKHYNVSAPFGVAHSWMSRKNLCFIKEEPLNVNNAFFSLKLYSKQGLSSLLQESSSGIKN